MQIGQCALPLACFVFACENASFRLQDDAGRRLRQPEAQAYRPGAGHYSLVPKLARYRHTRSVDQVNQCLALFAAQHDLPLQVRRTPRTVVL